MRRTAPVFFALLLLPLAPSQQAPSDERAKLLQDYQQSFSAWQRADALLHDPAEPKELLIRLKDAEAKWDAASTAKNRYLQAIRPVHQNHAAALAAASLRSPDTVRVEATAENIVADLTGDYNTLDRQLKTNAKTLSARRLATLRSQRDALAALRDLYRTRQRALNQLRQSNPGLERTRAALAAEYQSLAAGLAAQDESTGAENSQRIAAYEQIRRKAIQQATATPPKPAPAPVQPSAPPSPALSLPGKWALSAPRLEKFSDSAGPLYGDVSVHVDITQTGSRISGTYSGVVYVPPDEKYNRQVNFRFTGPAGPGPVIEAQIDSPLSGTVRLEQVGPDRLRISYRIDRTPSASAISFKIGETKELRREP